MRREVVVFGHFGRKVGLQLRGDLAGQLGNVQGAWPCAAPSRQTVESGDRMHDITPRGWCAERTIMAEEIAATRAIPLQLDAEQSLTFLGRPFESDRTRIEIDRQDLEPRGLGIVGDLTNGLGRTLVPLVELVVR